MIGALVEPELVEHTSRTGELEAGGAGSDDGSRAPGKEHSAGRHPPILV